MFFPYFIALAASSDPPKTLLCGAGYDAVSCSGIATSKYADFTGVLKSSLTGTISYITDLYIISKSADTFDLSALGLAGLTNLKIIADTAVQVTVKLPSPFSTLDTLDIDTAIAYFETEVSSKKITFSGTTTKGSLKPIENEGVKTVKLTAAQTVQLIDAPLYHQVIFDNIMLSINVAFDLTKNQQIVFKSNGFKILSTDLIIDDDHIPSASYTFIPTVTGTENNIVFTADNTINKSTSLELNFASITTTFSVSFDSTWGTSNITKKPTINLITPDKDKLKLNGSPTKNALFTIKGSSGTFYMYPITVTNIEFCLEHGCTGSVVSGATRIDVQKGTLAEILGGIESTVESLTILVPSDITGVELSNLSIKSELNLILKTDGTPKKSITLNSSPKISYAWELVNIGVILPGGTTTTTTIKTLKKDPDSTISDKKNFKIEQCIGSPDDCQEFTYDTYIYKGDTALAAEYEITFDENSFLINTNTKIELSNTKIKATNVEIRLDVTGQTDTNGIKFKPGTSKKAKNLVLSITSIDNSITSLPILFSDWTSVTNDITVDIIIKKEYSTKVSVSGVPDSKVVMILKDTADPYNIYDMKPITANSYGICIDANNAKCDSFYSSIKGVNIFMKRFASAALANAFIQKLPTTIHNISIGSGINIEPTSPLNLSAITTNISLISFTGLNINSQQPTPTLINVISPKESTFIKELILNHVDIKVTADINKTMEIINIEINEAATISGQYHVQIHEFGLEQIGKIKGGVKSDRVFIVAEFIESSYLIFDETRWTYLEGTDLTQNGIDIFPDKSTFESNAVFLKLYNMGTGKFTMKPKSKTIKKANTISLLIQKYPEEQQVKQDKPIKSLVKKIKADPSIITIDFDKDWNDVNLSEKFTFRIVDETKSTAIDKTNVNSKFINVVEKEVLSPPSEDEKELDPDPPKSGTPKPKGLSTGAIVGIVIGCIAVVAGIAVGVFFYIKKKKSRVSGGSP